MQTSFTAEAQSTQRFAEKIIVLCFSANLCVLLSSAVNETELKV